MEKEEVVEKKQYETPKLTVHGDVEAITLGDEPDDALDGVFTNWLNQKPLKRRREFFFS
jgi:hypothetical protein